MLSSQKILQSVAILLITTVCSVRTAEANKEVYQKTLKSTCWIIAKTSEGTFTGSGVVVDQEQKLVITNAHVTGSAKNVTVLFPQYEDGELIAVKKKYIEKIKEIGIKGRVIAFDPVRDLSLISLKTLPENVPAITLSQERVQPGDNLHSVGNPGASDALWVYTYGTARAIYKKQFRTELGPHDFKVIETQQPINRGDSGGPVVNDRGELIGLSQSMDLKARLISFCVELSEITAFLSQDRRPLPEEVESLLTKAGLKFEQNEAGPFSVKIKTTEQSQQEVFISEDTEFFGKMEARRVWSLAKVLPSAPSQELFFKLMNQNSKTKLGAWSIEQNANGQFLIIFVAKVEISAPPESIKDAMEYVSRVVRHLQTELNQQTS